MRQKNRKGFFLNSDSESKPVVRFEKNNQAEEEALLNQLLRSAHRLKSFYLQQDKAILKERSATRSKDIREDNKIASALNKRKSTSAQKVKLTSVFIKIVFSLEGLMSRDKI